MAPIHPYYHVLVPFPKINSKLGGQSDCNRAAFSDPSAVFAAVKKVLIRARLPRTPMTPALPLAQVLVKASDGKTFII